MLEYFGFYATPPESPDEAPAELDSPREAAFARAARLATRTHHTPGAVAIGRAWESSHSHERGDLASSARSAHPASGS